MVNMVLWLIFRNQTRTQMEYLSKYDLAQDCHLKPFMVFSFSVKEIIDMMATLISGPNKMLTEKQTLFSIKINFLS